MIDFERKEHYGLSDLLHIVALLRSEGGCPWDRVQTHASLRRSLLEEAYEVAEAIDREDPALLKEELGDLLLQVVFHADIERQAGDFTMGDVADGEVRKMLFRHPHVFGGQETVQDADTVLEGWEAIKRREKGQQTTAQALDAVARSLPGLWRAEKLQSKAARDGFDWPDISGALDKLDEEVSELHRAAAGDGDVTEELGDVLLQVVHHARIEQEQGSFDFQDVCDGICRKLIQRHPHVFADVQVDGTEQVLNNWEQIKQQSKGQTTGAQTLLSVPKTFPALMRAQKVQKRAAKTGFEYPDLFWAMDDLESELDELQAAIDEEDPQQCFEELGDVLFSAVNIARFLKVDAEDSLNASTEKFINRFCKVEQLAQQQGIDLEQASVEQMEQLWKQAKNQ